MLHRILPLGLALMGALMIIGNKHCARQMLQNHTLFAGSPDGEAGERHLLILYRTIALLGGIIFFIFGILISCGIVTLRKQAHMNRPETHLTQTQSLLRL